MILDWFFLFVSVLAISMGAIRILNYDLAFKIEVAIKRVVKMRLPEHTPQWENSSRFSGMLLVVLGVLNLVTVLSAG